MPHPPLTRPWIRRSFRPFSVLNKSGLIFPYEPCQGLGVARTSSESGPRMMSSRGSGNHEDRGRDSTREFSWGQSQGEAGTGDTIQPAGENQDKSEKVCPTTQNPLLIFVFENGNFESFLCSFRQMSDVDCVNVEEKELVESSLRQTPSPGADPGNGQGGRPPFPGETLQRGFALRHLWPGGKWTPPVDPPLPGGSGPAPHPGERRRS